MKLKNFLADLNFALFEALNKIDKNKKGFLIIVDEDNKLLGTITDGDIRRALIDFSKTDGPVDLKELKVEDAYNDEPSYVETNEKLQNIAELFKNEGINFLPVVNSSREVVNVITKGQFHVLLMKDTSLVLSDTDIINVDESILDTEVYPRPWGFYKTLFMGDHSHVKTLLVRAGGKTSYQKHKQREEFWVTVKGKGKVRLDSSEREIKTGDYIFVPKECKHQIINESDYRNLILIETQIGDYFGEDDIVRIEDEYERA